MSCHVFTYGTLMFEPVWRDVVRGRYESMPATLAGYERRAVRGARFPCVIPVSAGTVTGVVYFDVGAKDLARLDRFEGEPYERRVAHCELTGGDTVEAAFYCWKPAYRHQVSAKTWDPEHFARVHAARFARYHRG